MSTGSWIALGGLAVALALAVTALVAARRRLTRVERHAGDLEARLAAADRALAGRATDHPTGPPRLVLEPITGPVVKAVALGAGARHAVARLTRASRSGSR